MSDQAPDTSSTSELKAGHAPAIKVGGMRVGASRPRQTSQGDDKDKNTASKEVGEETATDETESGNNEGQGAAGGEDEADFIEEAPGTLANRVAGNMVSGTFVPIQKAFPAEAVKHIHDKPGTHPKHEQHSYNKHDDARFLNQPRKQ